MKLKVCGMRSPENILNLAKIMPDYMGFIFWEHSTRFVSNPTPELGKEIKKVGVFVNASLKTAKIWSLIITATFSSGDIDFWHKLQSWLIAQLNITK